MTAAFAPASTTAPVLGSFPFPSAPAGTIADPGGTVVSFPSPHHPAPAAARAPRVSAATYRRRRLVAGALAAGLVLGLASFGRQADAVPVPGSQPEVVVVVQPGDTLWSIARSLAPDTDPRPLVVALGDLAGGAALQPGQVLRVPASVAG